MTFAYFDCFSGISGDMILGALVDAGVSVDALLTELAKLNLRGYDISSERVLRAGIAATKVHVRLDHDQHEARHLSDITTIINTSPLSARVREKSIAVFNRLAEAEANVHGTTPEKIHFHEVGAVDAIVDIVGSVIGLELLGITHLMTSAINTGSGFVKTEHGLLPVPAPATVELLKGIPLYQSSVEFELATPTGAALASTLASSSGPLPHLKIHAVAYGAGGREIPGRPNVLRLMIGEPIPSFDEDASVVIETNIDDMNPQVYGHLMEKLMARGAQDVYLTPIIMKKGRPAVLLSVLAEHATVDALLAVLFRETTSIGVRLRETGRKKLPREIVPVETAYGSARVKVSRQGEEILTITPEYEDCRRLAEERSVPLKTVMEEVKQAFLRGNAAKS
ncbi:MAG TPA: nickel pincer cofactor biosynthesis protein LarC [Nitrospirota bacterium]|nr:nickel pincer cofactor biosynthesis protein LarC [Nitrospirota bacterium]